MSIEKILTDNTSELIKVKWDGERFALIRKRPAGIGEGTGVLTDTFILNPREMLDLIEFAGSLGGG